jgi:hypothetical protein
MGFSGTYVYSDGKWTPQEPGQRPEVVEPWLMVDVRDSDFTTVTYSPAEPGTGIARLGRAPGEGEMSQGDIERAAGGLANWWARLRGVSGGEEVDAKRQQIAAYLGVDPGADQPKTGDGGVQDPAEVFAELKTTRFLVALDLPVPSELVR